MMPRFSLLIALTAAAWLWQSGIDGQSRCQAANTYVGSGDLFYNYYTPSPGYGCSTAGMYPCPLPAPPLVGHTYITYQPLMPHEFMYKHRRSYKRIHPNGSVTRTRVSWR